MFGSSPAAVEWHPLHSNECMTLTGSQHPQGPAGTSVRFNFRVKAIRLFPHTPRPQRKQQLSASNVVVEHITQGKHSDGLHPGDTSKGSPNWHSFFQKQQLPAPGLITLPHQHKTQKTMLHPLEFSSKSVLKSKTTRHKLEVCMTFSITHSHDVMKPGQCYPSTTFCTKSH